MTPSARGLKEYMNVCASPLPASGKLAVPVTTDGPTHCQPAWAGEEGPRPSFHAHLVPPSAAYREGAAHGAAASASAGLPSPSPSRHCDTLLAGAARRHGQRQSGDKMKSAPGTAGSPVLMHFAEYAYRDTCAAHGIELAATATAVRALGGHGGQDRWQRCSGHRLSGNQAHNQGKGTVYRA
jgi:hypothetical protein